MCIFSPLSNTVYEWVETKRGGVDVVNERAEWMWRKSEEDIYLHLPKKNFYVFLFCIDIM